MDKLPEIVLRYLGMIRVTAQHIVYVMLDSAGRVTEWGGDVALLAPRKLEIGELITERLVGLVGILPVGGKSLVVQNVELEPGLVVHLHAIPAPGGECLVFLDAAEGRDEKRRKQQQGYDERLAGRAKRAPKRGD